MLGTGCNVKKLGLNTQEPDVNAHELDVHVPDPDETLHELDVFVHIQKRI